MVCQPFLKNLTMPIGNGDLSFVRRDAIPKGLYVVDPVLDGHVIEPWRRKRRCSAHTKKGTTASQVIHGPRRVWLTILPFSGGAKRRPTATAMIWVDVEWLIQLDALAMRSNPGPATPRPSGRKHSTSSRA